jgi:hypothetical protein
MEFHTEKIKLKENGKEYENEDITGAIQAISMLESRRV